MPFATSFVYLPRPLAPLTVCPHFFKRIMHTTGDTLYAKCQTLCLVLYIGHLAKEWFVECHLRQTAAHGNSTVCLVPETRQTETLRKLALCLVCGPRQSNTLGKVFVTLDAAQPTLGFAKCLTKHSAKFYFA